MSEIVFPDHGSILALDMAGSTGAAIWRPNDTIEFFTADLSKGRHEREGQRWVRVGQWLNRQKNQIGDLATIYYELNAFSKGNKTDAIQGGFRAILTRWSEHHNLDYEGNGKTPGQIKSFATNNGKATKSEMMQAANLNGWRVKNDDEADALALLHLALESEGIASKHIWKLPGILRVV